MLFEYQCTSGKFIRLPNRIEKIDSVARIESKLFCRNWNALIVSHVSIEFHIVAELSIFFFNCPIKIESIVSCN